MSNYEGRHRRPKSKKGVNTAITTLTLLGASIAIPVLGAGMSHAASVDTWDKIAQCESGGRWYLSWGHADSTGGLQIQTRTWNDYKAGISTAAHAYQASKEDQIRVAQKILASQGSGAWAVTTNGSACHGVALNVYPEPVFGSTAPKPVPTPPKTPATPTPPKSTPPATSGKKYTVVAGDTLSKIALKLNIKGGWQALYAVNKVEVGSNPNFIVPGQVLNVPVEVRTHTVKAGDTLTSIAKQYNITNGSDGLSTGWKVLFYHNTDKIKDPNVIFVGQVLKIPGSSSDSVSTPKPTTPAPTTPVTPKPTTPAPTTPSTNGWSLPLANSVVTQSYGNPRPGYSLGYHTGIDLMGSQGTPVKAVSTGTVVFSGYGYADSGGSYGHHIVLRLADGKYALYAHLAGSTVQTGQSVTAGQMIGYVGSTGNSSGPHLHFEIRLNPKDFNGGNFLNPVTYLRSKGLSL